MIDSTKLKLPPMGATGVHVARIVGAKSYREIKPELDEMVKSGQLASTKDRKGVLCYHHPENLK